MIFDENGGRIVGGRLDSRPPGGSLAYIGVVNKANLGTMGNIAFNALRDLRFRSMIIRLDGDLAGEFAARLTIDGVGLGQSTRTQRDHPRPAGQDSAAAQRQHHRSVPGADRDGQVVSATRAS